MGRVGQVRPLALEHRARAIRVGVANLIDRAYVTRVHRDHVGVERHGFGVHLHEHRLRVGHARARLAQLALDLRRGELRVLHGVHARRLAIHEAGLLAKELHGRARDDGEENERDRYLHDGKASTSAHQNAATAVVFVTIFFIAGCVTVTVTSL